MRSRRIPILGLSGGGAVFALLLSLDGATRVMCMHLCAVVDDRTYREKLSDEEYADKRSEIIANVLRWQVMLLCDVM